MAESDINADILRMELTYNPQTGVFTRRNNPRGDANKAVGRIATKGYRQISVWGKRYVAHRLAWLYIHGEWPQGQLDHINRNKDDNRIENLRVVTNKQNQENVVRWAHNKSGRRGVRFDTGRGKWVAEMKHYGKKHTLGWFDNIIDAVACRMRAEREMFTHSHVLTDLRIRTQRVDFAHGSIPAPGTSTTE